MVKYKILDHTADAAIEVFGNSFDELFVIAATGMFSLITGINNIKPESKVEINLNAANPEELLNKWLNELLYLFETEKMLFSKFNVNIKKEGKNLYYLSGSAKGEKYNPDFHSLSSEIKMATFHQLDIKKLNNIFSTKIVFDL